MSNIVDEIIASVKRMHPDKDINSGEMLVVQYKLATNLLQDIFNWHQGLKRRMDDDRANQDTSAVRTRPEEAETD